MPRHRKRTRDAVGEKIRIIKKEGLRGKKVPHEQAVAAAISMVGRKKKKRRKAGQMSEKMALRKLAKSYRG